MTLSSSKSKVYFFYQNTKFTLKKRTELKAFIESIFKKEGKKLESVNYIFSTDKAVLDINQQFLSHDFYTDIITFDLSETSFIHAEIYISIERVRENALQLGISFKRELLRVLFHGILHLCGYKDKSKADMSLMREKEDLYLNKFLK